MSHRDRFPVIRAAALALAVLLVGGCTETDELLVDEIGVTRVLVANPATSAQSVVDPQTPYQIAEWELSAATLELDGTYFDLLFENRHDADVDDELDDEAAGGGNGTPPRATPCRVVDNVLGPPVAFGPCAAGLVIDAADQVRTARLVLAVEWMRLRRGEPAPLVPGGDYDGDGIPDGSNVCVGGSRFACADNCPLLFNPDQADFDANGVGDVCTLIDLTTGLSFRDSDADAVVDGADNCVWRPNAVVDPDTGLLDQPDTSGTTVDDGVLDLIGDACAEQIASVELAGRRSFTLEFDAVELVQGRSVSALMVDFGDAGALDCDWSIRRCELDPSAIELCVTVPNALGC